MKLTFQLWNANESGNFPRCISEIWNLASMTECFQGCNALFETWSWFAELCGRIPPLLGSIKCPVIVCLRLFFCSSLSRCARRCEVRAVLLEQVGFDKRFPKCLHSGYHAAIQNRGFAFLWDSEKGFGTWDVPELPSLYQTTNLLSVTWMWVKSRLTEGFLSCFHRQFINSYLSGTICFLRNRFFGILQVLGNLLRDFLGLIFFSFPVLRIISSSLFEPDQPIDLLDVVAILENRVPESHKMAISELFCSQLLISISASASDTLLWAAFSPRAAESAFRSS